MRGLLHAAAPAAFLLALLACSSRDDVPRQSSRTTVVTPYGRYEATPAQQGVLAGLGVPDALPPVGARRWREPAGPNPPAAL